MCANRPIAQTTARVKIDMWNGETYNPKKHNVPAIFWSDGRLCYWGWIHNADGKEIGDFTADTAQDAEKALRVRFNYD